MHKKLDINEDTLNALIDLIEINEDYVLYDYRGKENQILIESQLVSLIENFLKKHLPSQNTQIKEYIKAYIRAAFELHDKSVVIHRNGNIFIKIIDATVQEQIDEKDKKTLKGRFNGVKEEELQAFYDEFFEDEENQHFFAEVAQEFVHQYFIVKKISNNEYEKNVFTYIHKITFEKLRKIYDDEDSFFLGFAGYIFRIHFKEVFEHIAERILDEIATDNKYMVDFLNYYSQDILVIEGVKYKIPHIEASNGLRWTVPSMLSIVKIYTKAKIVIRQLQHEKNTLKAKVEQFYVNGHSPVKNNELVHKKQAALDIEIEHSNRTINTLNDQLDLTKDEKRRLFLRQELLKETEIFKALKTKRQKILQQIVKQGPLMQYVALQKDLDTLSRKLQREKKILKQNEEAYNSIKNSLVKALISKKSVLQS
jgi:hypothetical protein